MNKAKMISQLSQVSELESKFGKMELQRIPSLKEQVSSKMVKYGLYNEEQLNKVIAEADAERKKYEKPEPKKSVKDDKDDAKDERSEDDKKDAKDKTDKKV